MPIIEAEWLGDGICISSFIYNSSSLTEWFRRPGLHAQGRLDSEKIKEHINNIMKLRDAGFVSFKMNT